MMTQELTGGCQCGAIRYTVNGTAQHASLCHCADCRKSAGAPFVHWAAYGEHEVAVTQGEPKTFFSSPGVTRSFCPTCGTGLFYTNPQVLPGLIDVQAATLDDPDAVPPQAQIMARERLGWVPGINDLPAFKAYPGMDED